MNKKAVELSMQTIIIAILSIVVLFVLIGIFTGQITWWSGKYKETGQELFKCEPNDKYTCKTSCGEGETKALLKSCNSQNVCCEKQK